VNANPAPADLVDRLHALSCLAGDLAHRFAGEAKDCEDPAEAGESTRLFLDAFKALRLGAMLALKLKAGWTPRVAMPAGEPEREQAERDDEPREDERDRDRDYEPVSLPIFLRQLGVVARAAEARADKLPADLRDQTVPELKRRLAAEAAPQGGPLAVLARPAPAPAPSARSRLLGSVAGLPRKPNSS
jgi:hypothetical protein